MIQWTMQKKPVNSFDFKKLCKRAAKTVRTKHKKSVKMDDARRVWDDYCEFGIIRPLLKYGNVKIDERTSIEIVGKRFEDDPKLLGLMAKGLNVNGVIRDAVKFDDNRYGVKYKIVFTDRNYKGSLIFTASSKLKKRVHEELKNTQTNYRILRNSNK